MMNCTVVFLSSARAAAQGMSLATQEELQFARESTSAGSSNRMVANRDSTEGEIHMVREDATGGRSNVRPQTSGWHFLVQRVHQMWNSALQRWATVRISTCSVQKEKDIDEDGHECLMRIFLHGCRVCHLCGRHCYWLYVPT
jgi:hypothetical protein